MRTDEVTDLRVVGRALTLSDRGDASQGQVTSHGVGGAVGVAVGVVVGVGPAKAGTASPNANPNTIRCRNDFVDRFITVNSPVAMQCVGVIRSIATVCSRLRERTALGVHPTGRSPPYTAEAIPVPRYLQFAEEKQINTTAYERNCR